MSDWYVPVDEGQKKREKAKARDLRNSQWWRQEVGKGVCYHCQQKFLPAELTMDHLVPIARGGLSNKRNCVPSCKACNTEKGSLTRAEMVLSQLSDSTQQD